MSTYEEFLATKSRNVNAAPVPHGELGEYLFPHQRDLVRWALRRGRAAVFASTGLGKMLVELEWARHCAVHGRVLILAPLAVSEQIVDEGERFGIAATYARDDVGKHQIVVTNYEMMHMFDPAEFVAVALDESSILKSIDGRTRTLLIESFANTPWRLASTATPAPNDHTELGNHAQFLGVKSHTEMLSEYFVHDGAETQTWRLKGHAEKEFWRWVCSWAAVVRMPSDLGHDDGAYKLPPLRLHDIVVKVDHKAAQREGMLFADDVRSLSDQRAARRATMSERIAKAAEIANGTKRPVLIWCELNAEGDALEAAIGDAVQVAGSDSLEDKRDRLLGFAKGKYRVLITKTSVAGWGLNLQRCSTMVFLGVSYSFEGTYQAVRRCWRFGQKRAVDVHTIRAETEGPIVESLRRKEADADRLAVEMVEHVRDMMQAEIHAAHREWNPYQPSVPMVIPPWLGPGIREVVNVMDQHVTERFTICNADTVEATKKLDDASVGFSVFSPPFESLYSYSASPRDFCNSRNAEEFWGSYRFLIRDTARVMKPGRLVAIHCMSTPTSKVRDGYIGLRDFPGEIIRAYQAEGFIYHSRITIFKDPVVQMQRSKALGLLHKQLRKDSSMSRQGIPDDVVVMRMPSANEEPIAHEADDFPVSLWQRYASPVWVLSGKETPDGFVDAEPDINPSETLQHRSAREAADEKHIAPLQLEVIRRCIRLWSNPNDVVWSPFAGIGSEGHVALQEGRRFYGAELKASYYRAAVKNLQAAERPAQADLFAAVAT